MAGVAKPSVEGLQKEGKITFLEYNDQGRFDKIETLLDGDIKAHTYGVLVYNESPVITFEIPQKSNIYAYGTSYSDGGGSTPQPVYLYKKVDGVFVILKSLVPTKVGQWYLLFNELEAGIYQIKYFSSYTMFTEWYVENLEPYKYLIKQGDNYISIKPEFYDVGSYIPLTLEGGTTPNVNDFINNGIEDLNDLLTTNTNGVVITGSSDLGSGKMFSFNFKEDYKSIMKVE